MSLSVPFIKIFKNIQFSARAEPAGKRDRGQDEKYYFLGQNRQEFTEQTPHCRRTVMPRDTEQLGAEVVEIDLRIVCRTAPGYETACEIEVFASDISSLATRGTMAPPEENLLATRGDAIQRNGNCSGY